MLKFISVRFLSVLGFLLLALDLSGQTHWRAMPFVREAEFLRGYPGGEGMQLPYSTIRSPSHPDRLYWAQDCGQIWRSDDAGQSWRRPACDGLYVIGGVSVQCDPKNPDIVFALAGNMWYYTDVNLQGIYRSADGGEKWQRVGPVDFVMDHNSATKDPEPNRYAQYRFCWDPATEAGPETQRRWFCVVNREVNPTHDRNAGPKLEGRLYRSVDGGRSWSVVSALPWDTFGRHDLLRHHPKAPGVLWLGCEKGLFQSTDGGQTFTRDAALATGRVRTLDLNPADPDDRYVTVDDQGLYRTRDGGKTWALVKAHRARGVAVHPIQRNVLYLYGANPPGTTGATASPLVSHDAGKTWFTSHISTEHNEAAKISRQYKEIAGNRTVVLPDPRDPQIAIVQSEMAFYRTVDGGKNFTAALQGITGMLPNAIWFDPFAPERFATFNEDTSMQLTENGGRWFAYRGFADIKEYRKLDWQLTSPDKIPWSSVFAGDFVPVRGSQTAVLSAGWSGRTRLIKTTNAGLNWKVVDPQFRLNHFIRFHRQDTNVVYADAQRSDDAGETFKPLAKRVVAMFEPNADIVFGVGSGTEEKNIIYRSTDRGETWHRFVTDALPSPMPPKVVVASHPTNPDVLFTPMRNGEPGRYDAKRGAWTEFKLLSRTRRDDTPNRKNTVLKIAVDPRNPEIIYVGVLAIGTSAVFRSTDGGGTWVDISFNLPRTPRNLAIHPHTGEVFFLNTGGGLYVLPPPAN